MLVFWRVSSSAIIMYLMIYHSMSYDLSLELIKKARSVAKPNITYAASLKEYYENELKVKW